MGAVLLWFWAVGTERSFHSLESLRAAAPFVFLFFSHVLSSAELSKSSTRSSPDTVYTFAMSAILGERLLKKLQEVQVALGQRKFPGCEYKDMP